jgi:hypothetical protein
MEDADQTQPEPVGRQFGLEIVLGCDQEAVVTRAVLARIIEGQNTRDPAGLPDEESRALLGVGCFAVDMDLVEQFLRDG